ncbi:hypothetical protein L1987_10101 [Smallanthus sonchifolius]|uniref:Uncharacterized protein n=1 Tax=Smallanthus sonchifolius TaxID=185202 RepID=A0ACB9JR54_9ASTR|nr:hypothetical protein L1987_10101 [Smallanthus sonchifolius]
MKLNPLVSSLSLYDIVCTPSVAADISHINTRSEVISENGSISGFDMEDDPMFVETSSKVRFKKSSSKILKDFRQSDMVNDCSDHHFVEKSSISSEKMMAKESSARMEHFGQRSSW